MLIYDVGILDASYGISGENRALTTQSAANKKGKRIFCSFESSSFLSFCFSMKKERKKKKKEIKKKFRRGEVLP